MNLRNEDTNLDPSTAIARAGGPWRSQGQNQFCVGDFTAAPHVELPRMEHSGGVLEYAWAPK